MNESDLAHFCAEQARVKGWSRTCSLSLRFAALEPKRPMELWGSSRC